MSNIKTLNAKREKLVAQLKLIDTAIKKEKEREQQQKSKAIFDALAARGLLDKDLDSILAAITSSCCVISAIPIGILCLSFVCML